MRPRCSGLGLRENRPDLAIRNFHAKIFGCTKGPPKGTIVYEPEAEARREWFRREVLPLEPELRAFAERLARSGLTEAADLVHDVMVRMITLGNWGDIQCPAAYAKHVLRNLAAEAARRSKIVAFGSLPDDDFFGIADERPDAEATALARDELRRLKEAIAAMPETMRRVFTLKKVYGRSSAEVADELGLSISSIEKYLTKGLRFCSEKLARDTVGKPRGGVAERWLKARHRDLNG